MDRLSDYDYELPERLIAQTPLPDRSASRLLMLDRLSGVVSHHRFGEVPQLLREGDLLVLNDTRVTALRLLGHKTTGGAVEALLIEDLGAARFRALVRPGRRIAEGSKLAFEDLAAEVGELHPDGSRTLQFEPVHGFETRLREVGTVPLPPYVHEALANPERYQTVFAKSAGSSAAPTAALHFTPEIFKALDDRGIQTAMVTLSVGIDTFRPVKVEALSEHVMHGERCEVSQETADTINRHSGRIIAVGTTSVRTLETFASGPKRVDSGSRESRLFIRSGYDFKIIDGMFTNFHLPRTTMLVMLSALAGREQVLLAYQDAVRQNYRFLSFGDSMLIL